MNLLKFYKDCMRTGRLPRSGLCICLKGTNELEIFKDMFLPTIAEKDEMKIEKLSTGYWGSGLRYIDKDYRRSFTPLRQTLVLLLNEIMKDIKKEKS